MNYKIIGKYIKEVDFRIPNPKTFFLISKEIGNYKIKMPLDWKMLIGEAGQSEMRVLPITSLNDRGFDAFTFNPLSSPKPDFHPIDVVDIYTEVKWYFPKIKSGQMLAVPLNNGPNPVCAYFVKDISRQCEQVDYGSVW